MSKVFPEPDTLRTPDPHVSGVISRRSNEAMRTIGPRAIAATNIGIEEFSGIVQQHRSLIFRFLLASLRDADMAETLTQEAS
jgi:hypothetical protein